MTKEMLKAAGIAPWETRCPDPPAATHAVFFDTVTADGPDCAAPRIFAHDVTVELYALKQDPAAEAAFEAELNARHILWTKQERYWLRDARRYQTIYEYTYIEKE